MNKRNRYILAAAALALCGVVAWRIIGMGSTTDARRQNIPIVKTEHALRQAVAYRLGFTGDIMAIQQANIFSKVSGNLDRMFVDIGAPVRRGQLLALIDTTELAQQLAQADATYQNARLNYERTKDLSEQNLVAKQDLDNAEASMKVSRANYESARTRLGYARITAPFGGYITKRYLDAGANVTSNNATLFTLMDIEEMKVIVNVQEKDIPSVSAGAKAVVTVDAFPGEKFTGRVTRFSQAVDLSTRTMAVEIDIPNKNHQLKPGMFANVILDIGLNKDAVTIPTQAILKDEAGQYVYVVENSVAHRKPVAVGTEQNGRTEVLSGLTGNEMVIVIGHQFARDSAQVIVQE